MTRRPATVKESAMTRQWTSAPSTAVTCYWSGPGLGLTVARRFAVGGYRVTLVARSTDGLAHLAGGLADTGAEIGTIEADASDPEGLGARMAELYRGDGAPSHHLQRGHGCAGSTVEFEHRPLAGGLYSRCHWGHRRRPGGVSSNEGGGIQHHDRHRGRVCRSSQPWPRSPSAKPLFDRPLPCSGPTWSPTVSEWLPSPSTDRWLPVRRSTLNALLSVIGRLSTPRARGRRSFDSPASRGGAPMSQRHWDSTVPPLPNTGKRTRRGPSRNRGPSPLLLDRSPRALARDSRRRPGRR